jgi:hypothetical protein
MNLDTMNEQSVREAIIYPLLTTLGYEQGTEADIITEYPLHYDRIFLGHRSKDDPILRGRADYVCQIVGVTRWTIEAKPPSASLTIRDVQQAFTYAVHPEVAAPLFVITNGREFRIYKTHNLDNPELAWFLEEMSDRLPEIRAVLGPDAIRRQYGRQHSAETAIAPGFGVWAKVAGGAITVRDFFSPNPTPEARAFLKSRIGIRSWVSEGLAHRTTTGQLRAEILVVQGDARFDAVARLFNLECFAFESADSQISTNAQAPSIFTGQVAGTMPAGTDLSIIPGAPIKEVPFDIDLVTDIRLTGFLERDHLKGAYEFNTTFYADPPHLPAERRVAFHAALHHAKQGAWGVFDLTLVDVGPDEVKRIHQTLAEARQRAGKLNS